MGTFGSRWTLSWREWLAMGLVLAYTSALRGDAPVGYKNIFCTLHTTSGIQTVGLRVPKRGGGECEFINASPTVIAGPTPSFPAPISGLIPPQGPGPGTTSVTVIKNSGTPPGPPGSASWSTPVISPSDLKAVEQAAALRLVFGLGSVALGNIDASGRSYFDCNFLAYDTDGILIVHSTGIAKIPTADLGATVLAKLPRR